MLFILDGTMGADIDIFLKRLQEETIDCTIVLYDEWIKHQHAHLFLHRGPQSKCNKDWDLPDGIIFLRVMPEIAYKRLINDTQNTAISLDYIQHVYAEKEAFFIENKNNLPELKNLPILVLNGNIDFKTDFSQFYNHLFYIRRLCNEIQKKKDIELGIYREKPAPRKCC